MTKKEQLKFIEDNYPLYNNHISNRRIRHTFFDTSLIYVVKQLLCCLIYRRFFLRMILM